MRRRTEVSGAVVQEERQAPIGTSALVRSAVGRDEIEVAVVVEVAQDQVGWRGTDAHGRLDGETPESVVQEATIVEPGEHAAGSVTPATTSLRPSPFRSPIAAAVTDPPGIERVTDSGNDPVPLL